MRDLRLLRSLPILVLGACGTSPGGPDAITVLSITPPAGAVGVALESAITLELSAAPPADFDVALIAGPAAPVAHAVQITGATVTITPSRPLALATSHQVEIAARGAPGQPIAAFAAQFETRDGAWAREALFGEALAAGAGAVAPALAVAADGAAFATWYANGKLRERHAAPGAGWNRLVASLDLPSDGIVVEAAAASASHAVAAYRYLLLGGDGSIDARTYAGTAWAAPEVVAADRAGAATLTQALGGVAAGPDGDAVALHRGAATTALDLYAVVRAGATWSAPILLEGLAGSATAARIVADGRGGFVVLWIQRGASVAVWLTTVSAQGVAATPTRLDDGPNDAFSLQLARGGDRVWLAWARRATDFDGSRVLVRALAADGLGPAQAFEVAGFSSPQLALAAGADGALVTWRQARAITAAVHRDGRWAAPTVLVPAAPDPLDDVGRPVAALDDRGNAVVAWSRLPKQGGRRAAMIARARAGRWAAPQAIDDGAASATVWAAGGDAQGRVTVVWTDDGALGYRVWAGRLE